MGRLDEITLEELQELREQTEGEIPRERVLAAIGRKQGDELETLAERHIRSSLGSEPADEAKGIAETT